MSEYFDRYKRFRENGQINLMPFIEIPSADTDLYIQYDKSKMRFDSLSYKYYGDANYGWLIMQANPKYVCMEFEMPDNITLRIPYPLSEALVRYNNSVSNFF